MIVQPFHHVKAGTTVYVSKDNNFVKIKEPNLTFIDLREKDPSSMSIKKLPEKQLIFEKTLWIPKGSSVWVILARMDVDIGNDLSDKQLQLLERGATYTLPLFPLHDDDPNSPELEATLFRLLGKSDKSCSFLGYISLAEPQKIKRDENIVAVLDLLGFTEIMRTHSLDELEKKFTQCLIGTLAFTQYYSGGVILFDEDGNMPISKELATVSYATISDTVLLYPRDRVGNPLKVLCETVSILLDLSLQMQWLFRGAIDIDSFRAVPEHNLYIGRALVTAHELELSQDWMGCILSDNVLQKFPEEIEEMRSSGLILEFEVPFKSSSSIVKQASYAINWCYFKSGRDGERRSILESLHKRAPVQVTSKLQSTLEFLDTIEQRRLFSKEGIRMSAIDIPFSEQD